MILVGVDYSEGSAAAARLARRMARERDASVRWVHVQPVGAERSDEPALRARRDWIQAVELEPEAVELRTGVPWIELVRVAGEGEVTLLVAGTHGCTGFQPLRLGTTATQVALRSTVPVLLVPVRAGGRKEIDGGRPVAQAADVPMTDLDIAAERSPAAADRREVADGVNGPNEERSTMERVVRRFLTLGLLAVVPMTAAACGKKEVAPTPAPAADDSAARREAEERARREAEERARREAEERARREAEAARAELERMRSTLAEMVFFDYDQSSIRQDAVSVLNAKATILRDRPDIRMRVEGHADERGSTEYNIALGMRRAEAIRAYLAGFGIAATRLETVSFGELRPLDNGRSESAWGRNRRGEFHVTGGMVSDR